MTDALTSIVAVAGAAAFCLHASADGAPVYERPGSAVVAQGTGWYVDAD